MCFYVINKRVCRIRDRDGCGPGLFVVTNIVTVIHQVFQYVCYSQNLNKNACAVCVLRKLGVTYTYLTNTASKHR